MRAVLVALALAGSVAADGPPFYWRLVGMDHYGDDIEHVATNNVTELEEKCNSLPSCMGFNTDGYIKSNVSDPAAAPCDLYLKKATPQPTPWPMIWPKPSQVTNGSTSVLLLPTTFKFSTTSTNPDLKAALGRYSSLVFSHSYPSSLTKAVEVGTQHVVAPKKALPRKVAARTALPGLAVTVANDSIPLQYGVDESYTLAVPDTGDTATLSAATVWGALRGLETFSQLVVFQFDSKTYSIAAAPWSIMDEPSFHWRGVLMDTSRHYQPVPVLERLLDAMSYAKLNAMHWHIVDSQSFPAEVPAYPKLWQGSWSPLERYTTEDVAHVVDYGRQRGVRVYLETDVPGHASSWCTGYPEICPSPTCREPLNPATNKTFDVIDGIIKSFTNGGVPGEGLVPDDFWHLGGDEVNTACWTDSSTISAWMQSHNFTADQTYEYFVLRAQAIAAANNRNFINWEEVWDHFGTSLNKGTVVHVWKDKQELQSVVAAGYRGILSDSAQVYLDHVDTTWETFYNDDPLEGISDPKEQALVLGGESCAWGEHQDPSDVDNTVWPRAAAYGERLWSNDVIGGTVDDETLAQLVEPRLAAFRCLLTRRGIGAEMTRADAAREAPTGPGSCFYQ